MSYKRRKIRIRYGCNLHQWSHLVDVQALQQQMKDKEQQENYERKRTQAFASDAVRNDKISQLLEKRQEQDIFELNRALNEFRSLHQQPDSRREFDLYDPDYLKKDKPARVSDDDPRCGISGLQKFEGEDLNSKARSKYQQEQLREWSLEQQRERDQAKRNQEQADRLYELKMRELDQRSMELQQAEEECRRNINMSMTDYNNALARERSEKERLKKQQELDNNMTEIANHVFGDVLTENPAVAQSAFGPHRRLEQEKNLRDLEFDRQRLANARAAMLLEREQERKREELNRCLADENRRLAQEQKSHQDYLEREVYTNPPSAAYFMQFNTSTR
ncbi:RIBC2-like protein [Mya arenaria]|uniref:RIBC2-like protein n=1 Tax=Mya arenaria TaxID=6604 RepID=A0ABY7G1W2_MYAAR|nr:RIBC2-like protein [Mya arenaria]